MSSLRYVIQGESWQTFFTIVIGTWLAVWLYAALHNQYLIRIEPAHFLIWHYTMPFFTSYTMLGVAYACGASLFPGIILGIALYIAGRLSSRPKFKPSQIIYSTAWVWLGVEICSILAGLIVWRAKRGIYPEWVYPDDSLGILITQSIQITAYLSGAIFSLLLVIWTWQKRNKIMYG